jgi:hypothetical protein
VLVRAGTVVAGVTRIVRSEDASPSRTFSRGEEQRNAAIARRLSRSKCITTSQRLSHWDNDTFTSTRNRNDVFLSLLAHRLPMNRHVLKTLGSCRA